MRIWLLSSILVIILSACAAPATPVTPTRAPTVAATTPPTAEAATSAPQPTATVSNEPVELTFTLWVNNEAQLAVFNEIATAYKVDHPNVSVKYVYTPFGDYTSNLAIQLAGNNPPDAGWLVENSALTFTKAGVLTDIAPALQGDASYKLSDFSDKVMALWKKDAAIYGVPFSTSPFVILYNRDLFEQAGIDAPDKLLADGNWTWATLREAAKTIKDSTSTYGYQHFDGGLYAGDRLWHNIVPVIRAYGGDAWDANNKCGLTSEQSVQAIQLLHDMIFVDKSMVPPGEQIDFYTGGAAMTLGQLSRVSRLAKATFKWDLAPVPNGPAGYSPVIGQAAVVVFNQSPNRDIAIDFVRFMTNQDNVTKLSQFFPPARVSVLGTDALLVANPSVSADSMRTAISEAIPQASVLPAHPQFPNIDLGTRPIFDKIWAPEGDVAAGLKEVCDKIQPLLDQ